MSVVAYCRVSTSKDEQLDSLQSQQRFFREYAQRNGYELTGIYADEGKSGTKMKNRTNLLRMLSDAGRGLFDMVLIKDVSRLARNTVDFLTSLRKLKALGVRVVFVNYDQTSSDSSEFMLTMLSAIAQEESANTSKRVKFGKRQNAEKGRVPNLVFGYDKTPGDYFHLAVNEREAETVRRIFRMYVSENTGSGRIAAQLNAEGVLTKRGCRFTQNSVTRILTNELYTGRIVNLRQEVEDFLTGKRRTNEPGGWLVADRPELRLIDDQIFDQAARLLRSRSAAFRSTGERSGGSHALSRLIRCTCCGAPFRRQVRVYRNTYTRWVCSRRCGSGADSCPNRTAVDEQEVLGVLRRYFSGILHAKPGAYRLIMEQFRRLKGMEATPEKELRARLAQLNKNRKKLLDLYGADLITLRELKGKTAELETERAKLAERVRLSNPENRDAAFLRAYPDLDSLITQGLLSHAALSRLIGGIEVDENRGVSIRINPVGPDPAVPLSYDRT